MTVPPSSSVATTDGPALSASTEDEVAESRALYVAPSLVEVGRVRALTFGVSGMGLDLNGFFDGSS